MKLFNILFILTITFFSNLVVAKDAPDFTISTSHGNQKLSDLKGQVIYLDFWASWCKPCRKSFPWMNKIQQQYKNRRFKIITINLDKDSSLMDKFLLKYPANFLVLADPKATIADLYHLQSMPSSYLIDSDGNIAFTHIGFFEKKQLQYEKEIESLLKIKMETHD